MQPTTLIVLLEGDERCSTSVHWYPLCLSVIVPATDVQVFTIGSNKLRVSVVETTAPDRALSQVHTQSVARCNLTVVQIGFRTPFVVTR